MAEAVNKNKNVRRSSANRRLRAAHLSVRQAILGFACTLGIFCAALICLKILVAGEHKKAVKAYNDANFVKIENLGGNSKHISGSEDGKPFDYVEDGKICKGVKIENIDIGGLDYAGARAVLLDSMDKILSGIKMTVSVENARIILTASDFGVTSNINDVLHEALKAGRKSANDYLQNYLERQEIADNGLNLNVEFYMNAEKVSALVDAIAEYVDTDPIEPYITFVNRANGLTVGEASACNIYDKTTVYAPNGAAVADIVFHNGCNGFVLNREDMLAKISAAFNDRNYGANLVMLLEEREPTKKAEELMANTRQITVASTEYKDSGKNRCRNLQKGATLLNCMIMAPDQAISFNEYLGPRREEDGWLLAHQIVNGDYVDSPGGGLCQVSTTLYNALLQMGKDRVEIIDRSHHSIPSDYVDKGLDATVSYPVPDFVWKCIGDSPLYLFAYADNTEKTIYMYIYGSFPDDGYTYKIYSKQISMKAPGEPLQIPEPLWPTGYSKRVITPRSGYTMDVYRQKYDREGNSVGEPELLYRDVYASIRGEYHYGIGSSDLPEPAF